jgi:prepilin-type processing-associated H-X9-DG protein
MGVGITASVLLVVGALLPALNISHPYSPSVKCASNLRQIGQAIELYANDHKGVLPARIEDLLEEDVNPEVLVCPSSSDTKAAGPDIKEIAADLAKPGHCSYVYIAAGMTVTTNAATIFAYEKLDHHAVPGMNVLYADGHVEWVDGKMAKHIRSELAKGFNPPRPPATAPAK